MKTILRTTLILIIALVYSDVSAQWATTGTANSVSLSNPAATRHLFLENTDITTVPLKLYLGGNSLSSGLQIGRDDGGHKILLTGNIGIGTANPVEKFQIGTSWTFHDGGHKIMGYNHDYISPNSTRINDDEASVIRFTSSGDIWFEQAGFGVAGSTINWGRTLVLKNAGNVGIGTTSPQTRLQVQDGTLLVTGGSGLGQGDARFIVDTQNSTAHTPMILRNDNGVLFRVNGNGNVGIGTTSPDQKLTIAGTAKAREVIVEETAGADFVFEKGYDLPTLKEIEHFIKANKHLEGIPSAEEMKANGVKVGELQMKLLQKIEELTLYVIDLKKENDLLKEEKRVNVTQQRLLDKQQHMLKAQAELIKVMQKELENIKKGGE